MLTIPTIPTDYYHGYVRNIEELNLEWIALHKQR